MRNWTSLLVRPRPHSYWMLVFAMFAYVAICAVLFVQLVNPTLTAGTDRRVAADSGTYLYMADVVREGRYDPLVWAALASFPNTHWMPVLIALALKNTFVMAIANFLLFWLSIHLFTRSAAINTGVFLFFLLLNPTTTVSLLAVNKEIVDMFVVALFCHFLDARRKWALLLALGTALINRYEVCVALIAFLVIESRLNPWRERRVVTIVVLIVLLSISLPLIAAKTLNARFFEASYAVTSTGLVAFLDQLEMHYLFALVIIPKVLENLFGELFNVPGWARYTLEDLASSYVLLFNNLATAIVLLFLAWKRSLKISSEWIYLALTIGVFMSISLVVQPRYFYLCYVLFCFQASQLRSGQPVNPQILFRSEDTLEYLR